MLFFIIWQIITNSQMFKFLFLKRLNFFFNSSCDQVEIAVK